LVVIQQVVFVTGKQTSAMDISEQLLYHQHKTQMMESEFLNMMYQQVIEHYALNQLMQRSTANG
jgi:S-adenosylmethionine synthetase